MNNDLKIIIIDYMLKTLYLKLSKIMKPENLKNPYERP